MVKNRKKKMGKKGSLIDLIFIAIGLLLFAVVTLVAFKITSEFNDHIQTNDAIPAVAKDSTSTLVGHYSGTLDKSFLFLCIGMAMATFVLASLVRIHPIFIPFFIIALLFVIFFAGIFSNLYQEMAATPELAAQAEQLVFISHILTYLPFIVGILGTILCIVMYKLWNNAQI